MTEPPPTWTDPATEAEHHRQQCLGELDPATPVALPLVPGCLPHLVAQLVPVQDHRVESLCAETYQSRVGCSEQCLANATASAVRVYGETVEVCTPPIPSGDHRADQPAVLLRNYQRSWISPE